MRAKNKLGKERDYHSPAAATRQEASEERAGSDDHAADRIFLSPEVVMATEWAHLGGD